MKKIITKEEWLKDVAKEVKALKKNATKNELSNLSLYRLRPSKFEDCIYGQMTGNCTSRRAVELIHKCCTRFSGIVSDNETFEETSHLINGNVTDSRVILEESHMRYPDIYYFSSIEHYILLKDSKPQNIIAYLKGETKTLVL